MSHKLPNITIDMVDDLLPQTQCGLCNYQGCRPYAQAMLEGKDSIDHCHPGGTNTLIDLANILNQDPKPYLEKVAAQYKPAAVVRIKEDECIGCTKCIQACPVDAIIGAGKQMHSIIEKDCNGCELCIEPCPVDCIDIIQLAEPNEQQARENKARNRQRYEARNRRLERMQEERKTQHKKAKKKATDNTSTQHARQQAILAALNRVKKNKTA
jgi:Na+-translocating ferredoxin:NAD+ oxidoreductase subunit B